MDKYESYRQELIQQVVTKKLDSFELIEMMIEQCMKIDELGSKVDHYVELVTS